MIFRRRRICQEINLTACSMTVIIALTNRRARWRPFQVVPDRVCSGRQFPRGTPIAAVAWEEAMLFRRPGAALVRAFSWIVVPAALFAQTPQPSAGCIERRRVWTSRGSGRC
jgi:hypothetical protein